MCCVWTSRDAKSVITFRDLNGGKGIPENIVTLCLYCHHNYDNGNLREEIGNYIREYLKSKYGDSWNEEKLIYNKWEGFKFK